jgi:hypothetical protein
VHPFNGFDRVLGESGVRGVILAGGAAMTALSKRLTRGWASLVDHGELGGVEGSSPSYK